MSYKKNYEDTDDLNFNIVNKRKDRRMAKAELEKEVTRTLTLQNLNHELDSIINDYIGGSNSPIDIEGSESELKKKCMLTILEANILDKNTKLDFDIKILDQDIEFKPKDDYTKSILEEIFENGEG